MVHISFWNPKPSLHMKENDCGTFMLFSSSVLRERYAFFNVDEDGISLHQFLTLNDSDANGWNVISWGCHPGDTLK